MPIAANPARTPMIIATIIINVCSVNFARSTNLFTPFERFVRIDFNLIYNNFILTKNMAIRLMNQLI